MKVIEFFGIPRAGKTTQRKKLVQRLQEEGLKYRIFRKPRKLLEKTRNLEELNFVYFEAMVQFYERGKQKEVDYLIFDRGLYDRIALITADYKRGEISSSFRTKLISQLESKIEQITHPFLFLVTPEISLQRKKEQRKCGQRGYSITHIPLPKDKGWLEHMFSTYKHMKEIYPEIELINTSQKEKDMHKEILNFLNLN